VKLVQSCQSAPTQLMSGTTEGIPPSNTRETGQQTSDLQLQLPTVAVTETVWTFSADDEQDATTATTPNESPDGQTVHELSTKDEIPEAQVFHELSTVEVQQSQADTDDGPGENALMEHGKDDEHETLLRSIDVQQTNADIYEDWSAPATTATKVFTTLEFDFLQFALK